MLPIYFFKSIFASLTNVKKKKTTHLKERYSFKREKMTNNGRDITNILCSMLDLNTVLNSTISCIIVMCGNREKTCLHLLCFHTWHLRKCHFSTTKKLSSISG